jgi:hypothetical protein
LPDKRKSCLLCFKQKISRKEVIEIITPRFLLRNFPQDDAFAVDSFDSDLELAKIIDQKWKAEQDAISSEVYSRACALMA